MLHHAAWLALRWEDPAFPAAFPWFGEGRYWEDLVLALREQMSAMQEPPLEPFG
jgi:Ser/Thr protein kinase RdoA (MazF antagonist)